MKTNKTVTKKFDSYPPHARKKLLAIRALVFEVAATEGLGKVTETLKWSEPSYSTSNGSPMRIDWKSKYPNQVSVYFNCQTLLIETFKEVHCSTLKFIGNREIALPISQPLPKQELKCCIFMALNYHKVKHLPLLGA